jgi:uncharacterized protein YydD (DUF2326 family)
MKLSKVYCNQPFKNTEFNPDNGDLNIILADVKAKTKDSDTHNLGKSTLLDVIDFLLLKGLTQKHWLLSTKNKDGEQVFIDYEFFLEILLNSGQYLTIRRTIAEHSKVSFKLHETKPDSFPEYGFWDYNKIALNKAKERLSEYLNFTFFDDKPYDYRKSLGYCLRGQRDYNDVFRLERFSGGKHKDWKPFMFDLLGFNGSLLLEKYNLDEEIQQQEKLISAQEKDSDIKANEKDKIVGQIQFKEKEKSQVEKDLDNLDFYSQDVKSIELADNLEQEISNLNSELYKVEFDIRKLNQSIEEKTLFDADLVKETFKQVKIYFPDNLTKSYQDLENFNNKLTEERNSLLRQTLAESLTRKKEISSNLIDLNKQKLKYSELIQENSVIKKYKEYQTALRKIENELGRLQSKLEAFDVIDKKNESIKGFREDLSKTVSVIENVVNSTLQNKKYTAIRNTFAELVKQVLPDITGLISIKLNASGNVDFDYDTVGVGNSKTAQDKGYTYRKVLCMAFDLAILINYRNESYFRFVYHDDAFGSEDNRIKQRLLQTVKEICKKYDIQYICTVIKDELPKEAGKIIEFSVGETVLRLHDKDDSGKLFLMSF